MPEFFAILIKVNIALVLFCLGYYLVLRKLTFYTLNRAYLVTGILVSSMYPFIDLSVFAQRHQDIVAPVQNVIIVWQAPARHFIQQAAYWKWLELLFWTGAVLFALRLLFQLTSLYKIYNRSTPTSINGQNIRVVKGDISPFSFWKSIYVNPEKLSATDLKNVLAHEQVHVDEWHTLDILLTEISVIFYWFNPGIWMMKRAVRENIEFITDRKILLKGMDSKAYQYSLLNITFNQPAPAITSNFNFSTLKKRIMMMNAKRSSKITLTRYAFLVPLVMVSLFAFSLSKAETVKTNPAFKAVADAVKTINNAVLNNDTVPASTRTVTGTVTVKKGTNGTTKTITLKGTGVNNLTFTIDSPRIERQTVTVTGKRPGQRDSVITFTIGGEPLGNFDPIAYNLRTTQFKNADVVYRMNAEAKALQMHGLTFTSARDSANRANYTTEKVVTGYGISSAGKNITEKVVTGYGTSSAGKNLTEKVVTGYGTSSADKYMSRTTKSLTGDTLNNKRIAYGNNLALYNSAAENLLGKTYNYLPGQAVQEANGLWHVITTDANGKQTTPVQPLYVVDGKEVNQKDLKSFNGSVVYLSGNTATEKYGEKGKNGVLVITTNKDKQK
ncbi:M56 family metallopeptidase [Mucilaginibacter calamicampi]|uniref:M56 family metallopeptidase n=1 Tax=Mucilaginibacter calamicampi TaxID=1302352 RepID=A0ABW2Z104_9SPHI